VTVRDQLDAELRRIRGRSPGEVLGVGPDGSRDRVRAAYLSAVKKYHPHRFGRESAEIQQLATEIFLVLTAAYDQLSTGGRRRRKPTASPPSRRAPAQQVRFHKRDRPAPAPAAPPPRRRGPTDHSDLVARLESEEEARGSEFREAVKLLDRRSFPEARRRFKALAVTAPANKRYRVFMHYAWGCEHQVEGRLDEARAELRRALALEPGFAGALEALEGLEAAEPIEGAGTGRAGLLGRWFRRWR
jgi:curved DNA-binding protein CbpA